MLDRAFWTTNEKKDWEDFWYNSEDIYPKETKHNYNELVDHLVSNMTIHSTKDDKEWTDNIDPPVGINTAIEYHSTGDINAPFDTQAYDNYQELVNNNYYDELYKEYRSMTVEEQITNLNELGKDCINKLDKIIDKLDDILEDKSGDAK